MAQGYLDRKMKRLYIKITGIQPVDDQPILLLAKNPPPGSLQVVLTAFGIINRKKDHIPARHRLHGQTGPRFDGIPGLLLVYLVPPELNI